MRMFSFVNFLIKDKCDDYKLLHITYSHNMLVVNAKMNINAAIILPLVPFLVRNFLFVVHIAKLW